VLSVSAAKKKSLASRPSRASGIVPTVARPPLAIVVEDHVDLRDAVTEMLEHDGWEVRAFGGVEEALQATRAALPDLVLTDVTVGPLSGAALARELRLDPSTAGIAVVAMSGNTAPTASMLKLFDLFLVKPVEVHALDGILRSVLARRRAY